MASKREEDENQIFDDDLKDLQKSVEKARRLALKKKEGKSGPEAIALLAARLNARDDQNSSTGEAQENKIVITEIEEFAWRHKHTLDLFSEANKPGSEDIFMEQDAKNEVGGWSAVADEKDEIVPHETIREVAVGTGLSGALKPLRDQGRLEETIEWGGRSLDKKKRKLVGIVEEGGQFSHKFHGKGSGKKKQEKRMKQYQEELKLKQMKNSDTHSLSVERMKEAQAQQKTPYLVLSGHVKPGNIEFDLTKEEHVMKKPKKQL